MRNRLFSRMGAACLHMALSFGALSTANATASYYRTRRGSYGGTYLADPSLAQLPATKISKRSAINAARNNSSLGPSDLHFTKGRPVRELVIVDHDVRDKRVILAQIKPGLDVVEINSGMHGIDAITSILSNYTGLDAVHIVSHAEAGALYVGGETVDQNVLQQHVAAFSVINHAIREGGDLLLYGCDLAKGDEGEQFLQLIKDNTHIDVAASLDKTGNEQYGGDWELEIRKGDIQATPLPGSLALKDVTETLQWSGTIDFGQVKNFGAYYYHNPSINAEVWESSAKNHVLIVDGSSNATYSFGDYISFGAYYQESAVVLKFSNNETFDPQSIRLFNWASSSVRYTITSDKGGSVTTASLPRNNGTQLVDLSGFPTGVHTLTITSPDGTFWGAVDDLTVQNLIAPGANTPPVVSSVAFSGTRIVGETLTGTYTFSDADGDAENGSTFQWFRSDNASGIGKMSIPGATSKNYVLQTADEGKFISFRVTPGDGTATGTPVESTLQGPVNALLTATITSKFNIACNGGSNGAVTVAASGGTSPYSYSWSPSGGTGVTASGLSAGTYTVTITDANGKTATATAILTQPAALVATISANNVSCNGGANGTASVSVSGGTAPYSYSWSPSGGTAATATGLTAGTYTVTVTDANSCMTTKSVNVTQPAALATTVSATNVSCNGGSNGTASVSVSGGKGPYSYSWSPSGGTAATATGLAAGTYTVTVTDANSCMTTKSVNVTQPSALAASILATNVSCNGGSNGTATISVSGGTAPYSYSWSPSGGTAATATGLAAGTYTVTVTDANSCMMAKSVTVTQPIALSASIAKTDVTTDGGSDGTATVTVSGGTVPYTYSWSPSGGTAAVATGLSEGAYTCTINDANDCVTAKSVTIVALNAAPIASGVSLSGIMTTGQTLTGSYSYSDGDGDAESGSAFQWYRSTGPSGSGKTPIAGANALTYTLTAADEGSYVSFEVTPDDGISAGSPVESALHGPVKPLVSAAITIGDTYLIAGESTAVKFVFTRAVAGFSNSDLTVANGTLSPVSSLDGITWTTTFVPAAGVEVSSNTLSLNLAGVLDEDGLPGAGTITSASFGIDTKVPTATITLSDDALRSGETATVTFTFTEAVSGFSAADISAGHGSVSSLATSDGVTWTATLAPDANVEEPANTIAVDQSGITDTAGNPGSGVAYSGNYQIDTKAPDQPGIPDVDPLSDSGDSDQDDLTNVTTPLVKGHAEPNSAITIYRGTEIMGSATADAGGKWIATLATLSEGGHDLYVVATDIAGNVSEDSPTLTIVVDTTPPAALSLVDLDTGSDTGLSNLDNITSISTPLLLGTSDLGTTVAIHSDRDGKLATLSVDESTGAWEFTTPQLTQGTHVITATARDGAGNESIASAGLSLTIDYEAPVVTDIDNQTIPVNATTQSLPFTVNDNLTPSSLLEVEVSSSDTDVVPINGIVPGGVDANRTLEVSGASSGKSSITITVLDAAGNQGSNTFLVTVNSTPIISGTPATEWNQDVPYSFIPTATDPDESDNLTFSIENKPSWATFDSTTGELAGTPVRDDVGVYDNVIITVSDGIASAELEPFTIEVLFVNAQPTDILLSSEEIEENQPAGTIVGTFSTIDSDENDHHVYQLVAGPGSADNAYFYIEGNTLYAATHFDAELVAQYEIRVQSDDGQGGSLEKTFEIRIINLEDARVFIPNLFSPNGDGSNETFRVRANGVAQIELRIFNRWGNLVYRTSDVQQATQLGWDGTNSGKQQPAGTYIWQLFGTFTDGTPILPDGKNTGNITLIR